MWWRRISALLLLATGILASEAAVRIYSEERARQQNDYVLVRMANARSQLESALNSTVFLAQGLAAYVVSAEGISPDQAATALKALYDSDYRIRNVGLAPQNRITYVYPTQGNERAIGFQYEDNPEQWPSVQRAMETRRSVLAGPVNLIQGGTAIINRTPIYLAGDRYWGVISTVIDLPKLLQGAELAAEKDGMRYWVLGDNSSSTANIRILGEGELPGDGSIQMRIAVPGGQWQLIGTPSAPLVMTPAQLWGTRFSLYGLSALLAAFAYALLVGHSRATQLAQSLTAINKNLSSSNSDLQRLSRIDPLTQLNNRRDFDEALEQGWRGCMRAQTTISILMIDIDHFKRVNDTYGHASGDAALVEVAATIKSAVSRATDTVARFGGEEFVVMTIGQAPHEANALAEKIRLAVEQHRIKLPNESQPVLSLTVSVGVATMTPKPIDTPALLIQRADLALYAAKNAGRNRVCNAHGMAADSPNQLAAVGRRPPSG